MERRIAVEPAVRERLRESIEDVIRQNLVAGPLTGQSPPESARIDRHRRDDDREERADDRIAGHRPHARPARMPGEADADGDETERPCEAGRVEQPAEEDAGQPATELRPACREGPGGNPFAPPPPPPPPHPELPAAPLLQ